MFASARFNHLGTRPRGDRRPVAAAVNVDRGDEVLVEMVDELDHPALAAAGNSHRIEHRQMLHEFAQSDSARVGTDRYTEAGREEQDRNVLVDAGHTGRIDLQDLQCPRLEELLEHDPIGHVLTGRDPHR